MQLHRLTFPALAVCATALLLLPTDGEAFVLIGGSLNLDQRDVRVFNNFTAPSANNNTVEHPSFPGYDGAELAIWKAASEWGSRLHGDGSGDSVGGLIGSGGANFDISWQGNAVAVGGTNDNTCSQLNGGISGVYAFVEAPISDGWRMRFLRDRSSAGAPWAWQDGPGDEDGGNDRPDLQGIATHEYGHSLGLGHSAVGNATMVGATSPEGSSNARSIAGDDIAGVRAIYGQAAANKPAITNLDLLAQQLRITGSNFHATSNEVWFTQVTVGGNGTPVKALNVPSSAGGTVIVVTVPGNAGPGDVLVRHPGNAGRNLSNAFPFNTSTSGFGSFCNLGDSATFLCPCGNPGNGLGGCDNADGSGGVRTEVVLFIPNGPAAVLLCTNYPPMSNQMVVLLRSTTKLTSAVAFGDGMRCIDVPVVRLAASFSANGQSAHSFGHGKGPGTFHYQPWYRNTPQTYCNATAAFNMGSGVSIVWP